MQYPSLIFVVSLILFQSLQASAGGFYTQSPPGQTNAEEEAGADTRAYSVSTYLYVVPDDQNYASAIFTADRSLLHLEGRINYEDLRTGSAWVGYNFSAGEKWVLDVTPMFGGVFGEVNGVAPGWEITLSHGKLEIYGESEYVFDLEDSSGNFYYNWSQITFSPVSWLELGLVGQRTKAYRTDLDVQRGLFAGFSYKALSVTAYVINPGWDRPTILISAGLAF